MTDNEIIKALECCTSDDEHACNKCPSHKVQCVNLMKESLDLIKRLQEENEILKELFKGEKWPKENPYLEKWYEKFESEVETE